MLGLISTRNILHFVLLYAAVPGKRLTHRTANYKIEGGGVIDP